MAAATSATHAMTRPAGQWAILAPKVPLPLLSLPRVCLPSYAVSFSGSLTALPAYRLACASGNDQGTSSVKNPSQATETSTGFSGNSKLICCKIYISGSRNKSALDKIDVAARSDLKNVVVLSKFGDAIYNRVRYTLVSYISTSEWKSSYEGNISKLTHEVSSPIRDVLKKMVDAAFDTLSLDSHNGWHPRIGIIDDLSFHPLGEAKMEDAVCLAKDVATYAGSKVPVFLYDEAHPERKAIGDVRRAFSYFKKPENGLWSGVVELDLEENKPDVRPTEVVEEVLKNKGVTTIGATPFLEGYNVPVRCEDIKKVKDIIVDKLREQLGGRGQLLALALRHGSFVEVGCLFDPNHLRADQVEDKVKQIAAEQGLEDKVEKGYYTDITKDKILVELSKALF